MTFESAQTHFRGQKGWNDLAPDALDLSAQAQKGARGRTRPKRVVTPMTTAGDLPTPQASSSYLAASGPPPTTTLSPATPPLPTSSNASLSSVSPSAPPSIHSSAPPSAPPSIHSSAPPSAPPSIRSSAPPSIHSSVSPSVSPSAPPAVNIEDIRDELAKLTLKPSELSEKEVGATAQKIELQLSALPQHHMQYLKEVLDVASDPGEKVKARKMLVDYSLVHSNVSSWTVPLRRLIEKQIVS